MNSIEQQHWTRRLAARRLAAWLAAVAVLVAPLAMRAAHADSTREQARQHYLKGKELFSAGDYRGAIEQFETADRLAPSPVLDFNIGLAYDQLGDSEQALAHYKAYLAAMPNASNKDEVQAKIDRIEGELRAEQEAARRTRQEAALEAEQEAARKAEQERRAEEAATEGPAEAAPATGDAAAGDASEAGSEADSAVAQPSPPQAEGQDEGPQDEADEAAAGSPAAPRYAPTGDPKLDRVAAIDVAAIRDQRVQGMGASGDDPQAGVAEQAAPEDGAPAEEQSKPAYKQWWFWAVVGVSAIILVDIASSDSQQGVSPQPVPGALPGSMTGAPVLRF